MRQFFLFLRGKRNSLILIVEEQQNKSDETLPSLKIPFLIQKADTFCKNTCAAAAPCFRYIQLSPLRGIPHRIFHASGFRHTGGPGRQAGTPQLLRLCLRHRVPLRHTFDPPRQSPTRHISACSPSCYPNRPPANPLPCAEKPRTPAQAGSWQILFFVSIRAYSTGGR